MRYGRKDERKDKRKDERKYERKDERKYQRKDENMIIMMRRRRRLFASLFGVGGAKAPQHRLQKVTQNLHSCSINVLRHFLRCVVGSLRTTNPNPIGLRMFNSHFVEIIKIRM